MGEYLVLGPMVMATKWRHDGIPRSKHQRRMWTIRIVYSLKPHLIEQRLCASLIHVFKNVHFCSAFNLFSFHIVLRVFNLGQRGGDVLSIWCDNHSSPTWIKVHPPQCIWRILTKYKPKSCLLILLFQVRCLGDIKMIHHNIPDAGGKMWINLSGGLEVTESSCAQPGRHNSSGSSNTALRIVIYQISAGLECTPGHWHPAEC